jgi:hypothetical protein
MASAVFTETLDHLAHQPSNTTQPTLTAAFGNAARNGIEVVNADQVLAYGSAESHLAARNAVVLQCLNA